MNKSLENRCQHIVLNEIDTKKESGDCNNCNSPIRITSDYKLVEQGVYEIKEVVRNKDLIIYAGILFGTGILNTIYTLTK